jgi:ankyrin repeat protein
MDHPFTKEDIDRIIRMYEYDTIDTNGDTPLTWLLTNHITPKYNLKMIKSYLQNGGSVSKPNATGKTPLYLAILDHSYNPEVIDLLFLHGAGNIHYEYDINYPTNALIIPQRDKLYNTEYSLLNTLHTYGINLIPPIQNMSLLHLYSSMSNYHDTMDHMSTKCVRLLLQKGANPNIQDDNGITPLMISARYSRSLSSDSVLLTLLRSPKINVNIQCKKGYTAFMYATKYSNTTSSIRTMTLILDHPKINIHHQNEEGDDAVMIAIKNHTKSSHKDAALLSFNSRLYRKVKNKIIYELSLKHTLPDHIVEYFKRYI